MPSGQPVAPPALTVRQVWFDEVIERLQTVNSGALDFDPDDAQLTLERLGRALARPETHIERLILRGLLLEVACRCGHQLHVRECDRAATCDFAEHAVLEQFLRDRTPEPIQPFLRWIGGFFSEFSRVHPQTPARKLARLLRRAGTGPFDTAAWAAAQGLSDARLRRAFVREFGQSIRDYQRCARIVAALDLAGAASVAHVAAQVGYRSRKNFYRAFTRLTGTTPAAFRRLPAGQRGQIVESARLSLTVRKSP